MGRPRSEAKRSAADVEDKQTNTHRYKTSIRTRTAPRSGAGAGILPKASRSLFARGDGGASEAKKGGRDVGFGRACRSTGTASLRRVETFVCSITTFSSSLSPSQLTLPAVRKEFPSPGGAPRIHQLRDQLRGTSVNYEKRGIPGNSAAYWFREEKALIPLPRRFHSQLA